jgi:hypothetical protein
MTPSSKIYNSMGGWSPRSPTAPFGSTNLDLEIND